MEYNVVVQKEKRKNEMIRKSIDKTGRIKERAIVKNTMKDKKIVYRVMCG